MSMQKEGAGVKGDNTEGDDLRERGLLGEEGKEQAWAAVPRTLYTSGLSVLVSRLGGDRSRSKGEGRG